MDEKLVMRDGELVSEEELRREHRAREVAEFLDGRSSSRISRAFEEGRGSAKVAVEVGEKRDPYERKKYNPDAVIRAEDDFAEQKGTGYTVLRPSPPDRRRIR
jgi:hypothetical protein